MPTRLVVPARIAAAALVALGSLNACSSTGSAPGSSTRSLPVGTTGSSQGGIGLESTARNDGQEESLAAPPADVYQAILGAYESLKIPVTRQDPSGMVVGNDALKLRRQLGRIEMRKAFECGGTPGTPNSETYEIFANIATSVRADGSNSVMTTVLTATAENPSYPASGVRCGTNGVIESAITNEVKARLNSR